MWRIVQFLWLLGVAETLVIWFGLPVIIRRPGDMPITDPVVLALVGVALLDVAFTRLLHRWLRARVRGDRSLDHFLSQVGTPAGLIAWMASTPPILGVAAYMLTGSRALLAVFCTLGLIALALFRPRLDAWHDAPPAV